MSNEELKALLQAEDNKRSLADSTPRFEDLMNMSDEQAADILDDMLKPQPIGGRHNGKTYLRASRIVAVVKAINKLRGSEDDTE